VRGLGVKLPFTYSIAFGSPNNNNEKNITTIAKMILKHKIIQKQVLKLEPQPILILLQPKSTK